MLFNLRPSVVSMPTVIHPFLTEGVEARAYQIRALQTALTSSCLMVMPTGFGKTAVEWMVMAEHLRTSEKKIILIAPTTGLVAQQQRMAREMLNLENEVILRYTGETPPDKRSEIWGRGRILMATPQVIRNDASCHRINLSEVSLIVFDEAHHATGNHAYAQVGDLYRNQNPDSFSLAATASPGTTKGAIYEVAQRLGIDSFDVSTKDEPLLKSYAVTLYDDAINVELPDELKALIFPLQEHQANEVESIQRMGYMGPVKNLTSKIITDAQNAASKAISRRDARGYNAAKRISDIRRMHMLLDLLKTQGVRAALAFLDKAEHDGRSGDRATNRFLATPVIHNFRTNADDLGELHPKAAIVEEMVKQKLTKKPECKILIFTEFRYTVTNLLNSLSKITGVRAAKFIGQATSGKQKGMTQKQQLARLEEFRNGDINVLIATSVGEEGLDVPAADLVLMYEPVPSAIRSIQRRGRTARQRSGTVKTLIAKNTRDQFVNHAAKARERKMYENLAAIKRDGRIKFNPRDTTEPLKSFKIRQENMIVSAEDFLSGEQRKFEKLYPQEANIEAATIAPVLGEKNNASIIAPKDKRPRNQMGLDQFFPGKETEISREDMINTGNAANAHIDSMSETSTSTVTLDYRESSSTLSAYISSLGITIEYDNLQTGDILINDDICIERKTSRDLLTSIIDQRLFKQCQRMTDSDIRPLLLIEMGEIGNSVHPNAVLGALAHVTLELGIPTITTKNSMESAHLIYLIAKQHSSLTTALRDYTIYEEIDEKSIDSICEAASIEIQQMINENVSSEYLVKKWSEKGVLKQIELLSSITGLTHNKCSSLIERFKSIGGFFKAEFSELSAALTKEEHTSISWLFEN